VTGLGTGKIVVTWAAFDADDPDMGGALRDAGYEVEFAPSLQRRTPEDVRALVRDAVAVIATADPFDRSVFESARELRVIVRTGVGVDAIDLDAATAAGVAVAILPGVNHETCADHTLALMLAVIRRVVETDSAVRAGAWPRGGALTSWDLHGACVGLVGFGRIGQAVARRLEGFDVELLVADPAASVHPGLRLAELDEILQRADLVSLHLPHEPTNGPLLGERELKLLKSTAILVNTARGGLVDQAVLEAMLRDGRLRGAALDVFEDEPPQTQSLVSLPNVVSSPHIAGLSVATNRAMSLLAVKAVVEYLDGGQPAGLVNLNTTDNGRVGQPTSED
jgi:phosphoglycerate dehydrogenase-like enzyme